MDGATTSKASAGSPPWRRYGATGGVVGRDRGRYPRSTAPASLTSPSCATTPTGASMGAWHAREGHHPERRQRFRLGARPPARRETRGRGHGGTTFKSGTVSSYSIAFALARYLNSTPTVTTSTSSTTTTTTTTTALGSTTTTVPCLDAGFDGVRCVLRGAIHPADCGDQTFPHPVQRRLTNLIDRGAGTNNPKKARTLVRKAGKALKRAAALVTTAAAKGKLSTGCGDMLGGILREAQRRAEELAATL